METPPCQAVVYQVPGTSFLGTTLLGRALSPPTSDNSNLFGFWTAGCCRCYRPQRTERRKSPNISLRDHRFLPLPSWAPPPFFVVLFRDRHFNVLSRRPFGVISRRAQEELFALPFVGWIMASHGGIPINRRNRASAVQVRYFYNTTDTPRPPPSTIVFCC